MFRGIRNGALALGLKSFLNERFGEYGEIVDCDVDTEACTVRAVVRLRGETQNVSASIDRYELQRVDDDVYVVLKTLSCSREWLSRLLGRLLAGKRYKIPGPVAALL